MKPALQLLLNPKLFLVLLIILTYHAASMNAAVCHRALSVTSYIYTSPLDPTESHSHPQHGAFHQASKSLFLSEASDLDYLCISGAFLN